MEVIGIPVMTNQFSHALFYLCVSMYNVCKKKTSLLWHSHFSQEQTEQNTLQKKLSQFTSSHFRKKIHHSLVTSSYTRTRDEGTICINRFIYTHTHTKHWTIELNTVQVHQKVQWPGLYTKIFFSCIISNIIFESFIHTNTD